MSMISAYLIFHSFENIRETSQCFHNMLLYALAKVRQFAPPTFFLTYSEAEFRWTDTTQIVAD